MKQGGKENACFLRDCAVNPLIGPFGERPEIAVRNIILREKNVRYRPTSRKADGRTAADAARRHQRIRTSCGAPQFAPAPARAIFGYSSCLRCFPASLVSNAIASSTSFSRMSLPAVSMRWRYRQPLPEKPCQRAEFKLPIRFSPRVSRRLVQRSQHRTPTPALIRIAVILFRLLRRNLEPVAMEGEYLAGLGNGLGFVDHKSGDGGRLIVGQVPIQMAI